MSIRITGYQMNAARLSGGAGNFGDARFGYQWAIDNSRILSEPITLMNIGDFKMVPMDEIHTERYYEICQNKAYFNNTPPTPELDKDDPNMDMARIFNPVPQQIVKKGSLFLFGQQKFKGVDSFRFQNEKLSQEWKRVWTENNMDSKLIDLAQSYLRDGDVFYKVVSKKIGNKVLGQTETEEGRLIQNEEQIAEIKFVKTDAAHWSAIVSINNPDIVLAWIYQFEKADGKYIREEYFLDRTIYYEGEVSDDRNDKKSKITLFNSGAKIAEKVKFVVVKIEEHNLNMFPLVRFKNNEQSTFWGKSIYNGHYGQFDRLNEIYTQLGYAIKMMSDPLLWIAGAEAADQNTKAADAVWSFSSSEASLNVLQWPGIPDSIFKYIELLESKIYDAAFVPRSNDIEKIFGSENRMSGKGLQELKGDIVDATMSRRNDFEAGFKQMLELVSVISGIKVLESQSFVDVVWGPVFQSGSAEKRESLLNYYEQKIISRERVIDLSDDFPPEMKEELKQELDQIDRETVKLAESMSKAEAPKQPIKPQPARRSRRSRKV